MPDGLPRGTVTFLFTDIAGSTRLLRDLGETAYATALADHRQVIRDAAAVHGGVEVDTQGDAFFIAFPSAAAGVAAASAARDGLAATRIRVRMGLHTGTPLVTDEGYVGTDVHLAARIAATAHGGQVVLSEATRATLDPAVRTTDLGEHRLKDIDRAVVIHQLGDEAFAPLRSIANTSLPTPISSFLGRSQDVAAVVARIDGGARLVTLTGPGGTGKTRLSLEVARRLADGFPAGVWWVGLASIRDPTLVLPTIAGALGTTDDLASHIGRRRMLLVIDNMEQVVAAAADLAGLLAACPGLVMIVTSRITLRIAGEAHIRVGSLDPDDAVALFLDRSGLDSSPEVAELCRRLDRMPLAVELAAARARMLGPRAILDRLGDRLDLLKGGRDLDPRQQTLRATIAWSDELLDGPARALFRRLSVFAGGCSLDAAETVVGADIDDLQTLVEHSLVRMTHDRFWMLETIRAYAADTFAGDPDRETVERAFTDWAIDLVEREDRLVRGPRQVGALERLDREIDNVRAAYESARARDDTDAMFRIALRSEWWLARRGFNVEIRQWLVAAIDRPGGDPGLRGWALVQTAPIVGDPDAVERARSMLQAARALGEQVDDQRMVATALELLGFIEPGPEGLAMMEQAGTMFDDLGLADERGRVAIDIAARALNDGDDERAARQAAESVRLGRALGNRHGIGVALANEAAANALLGRMAEARGLVGEAAAVFDEIGEIHGMLFLLEIATLIEALERPGPLAARMAGSVDAAFDVGALTREPSDERIRSRTHEALTALGREEREAAFAAGATMDPRTMAATWLAEPVDP